VGRPNDTTFDYSEPARLSNPILVRGLRDGARRAHASGTFTRQRLVSDESASDAIRAFGARRSSRRGRNPKTFRTEIGLRVPTGTSHSSVGVLTPRLGLGQFGSGPRPGDENSVAQRSELRTFAARSRELGLARVSFQSALKRGFCRLPGCYLLRATSSTMVLISTVAPTASRHCGLCRRMHKDRPPRRDPVRCLAGHRVRPGPFSELFRSRFDQTVPGQGKFGNARRRLPGWRMPGR